LGALEGPKFEAEGREWGTGSWGDGCELEVWVSAVSSPSGVRGRDPEKFAF